jgi:hypothetical protein
MTCCAHFASATMNGATPLFFPNGVSTAAGAVNVAAGGGVSSLQPARYCPWCGRCTSPRARGRAMTATERSRKFRARARMGEESQ